jgi:hypothetical protein
LKKIEDGLTTSQRYYQTHKQQVREWYEKNKEHIKKVKHVWYLKNREIAIERSKSEYKALRLDVLMHYGGKCSCPKCPEKRIEFLTIDHSNNNGKEHRRTVGMGTAIYRWIRDNNYPKDLRAMCMNCNAGRSWNGGVCPHLM